jgi:hypothetical protein
MKRIVQLVALLGLCSLTAHARLGETPKELFERYGGRVKNSWQKSDGQKVSSQWFFDMPLLLAARDSFKVARQHPQSPPFDLRQKLFSCYGFDDAWFNRWFAGINLIMSYESADMREIVVYYRGGKSVAEVYRQKETDWNGKALPAAMVIGPRSAGVEDFRLCPTSKHQRSYFSATHPEIMFNAYYVCEFTVVNLNENSPCYREYAGELKDAVKQLENASKH